MKRQIGPKRFIFSLLVIVGSGLILSACLLANNIYKTVNTFAPFDFLEGATVVPEKAMKQTRTSSSVYINGVRYLEFNVCYTLPKDFVDVRARAEPELMGKGFQIYSDDKSLGTSYRRVISPTQAGDPLQDSVTLFKNLRYRTGKPSEPYTIGFENIDGWTSVQVILLLKQSSFETFLYRCWEWLTAL